MNAALPTLMDLIFVKISFINRVLASLFFICCFCRSLRYLEMTVLMGS